MAKHVSGSLPTAKRKGAIKKEVKKAPVVSVLMTVLNTRLDILRKAMDSVSGQDYDGEMEVVVVDNGSEAELGAQVELECRERGWIFTTCQTKGRALALEAGMAVCQGEYVAKMDSDDVAQENWISEQLLFMKLYPEAIVAGCQLKFFGEQNGRITKHPLKQTKEDILAYGPNYFWVTNHPGVFLKREEILAIGGYGELETSKEEISEDFHLWCKVLKAGHSIYTNPKMLMNYRYASNPLRYSARWYSFLNEQKNALKP